METCSSKGPLELWGLKVTSTSLRVALLDPKCLWVFRTFPVQARQVSRSLTHVAVEATGILYC